MAASRSRRALGILLRVVTGAAALSLVVYVPYRYATRPPEFEGFLGATYALLFPLALVLAVAALWVAWRPEAVRRVAGGEGGGGSRLRWVFGVYGGLWVAMGLMCLPSLTDLAAISPIKGLFSTVHMTAQHVYLGFGAVAVAVWPAGAEAVMTGREAAGAARRGEQLASDTGAGMS